MIAVTRLFLMTVVMSVSSFSSFYTVGQSRFLSHLQEKFRIIPRFEMQSTRFRPKITLLKSTKNSSVSIVGAGAAGLCAALEICRTCSNKHVTIYDSAQRVGGRLATFHHPEGYLLDVGFAVFIDSYPVVKRVLGDAGLAKLDLRPFEPGSLVFKNSRLSKVADPLRRPKDLFSALASPVGSLLDKMKVARLLLYVFSTSLDEIFAEPETTTLQSLQNRWNFSPEFIEVFFRPFLGGIFLSDLDEQSSRMFLFVFKMFATGSACLPARGMGSVGEVLKELVESEFSSNR